MRKYLQIETITLDLLLYLDFDTFARQQRFTIKKQPHTIKEHSGLVVLDYGLIKLK